VLELAFSISEPTTPGSMRGMIPRRAAEVGSVGSLQRLWMSTTKLLKFCSAATRPIAASSAPLPSSERIKSACWSYDGSVALILWVGISLTLAHGLAAPRRVDMD
jgi:hypothetical protein